MKRKASSTGSKKSSKRLATKAEKFNEIFAKLDSKFVGKDSYGDLDALLIKAKLDPKELGSKIRKITALTEAYCNGIAQ